MSLTDNKQTHNQTLNLINKINISHSLAQNETDSGDGKPSLFLQQAKAQIIQDELAQLKTEQGRSQSNDSKNTTSQAELKNEAQASLIAFIERHVRCHEIFDRGILAKYANTQGDLEVILSRYFSQDEIEQDLGHEDPEEAEAEDVTQSMSLQDQFKQMFSEKIADKLINTKDDRLQAIYQTLGDQGLNLLVREVTNNSLQQGNYNQIVKEQKSLADFIDERLNEIWDKSVETVHDIVLTHDKSHSNTFDDSEVDEPQLKSWQGVLRYLLEDAEVSSYFSQKLVREVNFNQGGLANIAVALGGVSIASSFLRLFYDVGSASYQLSQGKQVARNKQEDIGFDFLETGTMIGGALVTKLNPLAAFIWFIHSSYEDYQEKQVFRPLVEQKANQLQVDANYQHDHLKQLHESLNEHVNQDAQQLDMAKIKHLKGRIHQVNKAYQQTSKKLDVAQEQQKIIEREKQSFLPRKKRRLNCYIGMVVTGSILTLAMPVAGLPVTAIGIGLCVLDGANVFDKVKQGCKNLVNSISKGKKQQRVTSTTMQAGYHQKIASTQQILSNLIQEDGQLNQHKVDQVDKMLQLALKHEDCSKVVQLVKGLKDNAVTGEINSDQRQQQFSQLFSNIKHAKPALEMVANLMDEQKQTGSKKGNLDEVPRSTWQSLQDDNDLRQALEYGGQRLQGLSLFFREQTGEPEVSSKAASPVEDPPTPR